jgi:hypothetical protein
MLNLVPCCTGHEAKDMGSRAAGISAHHYFHCQRVSGELSDQRFYPSLLTGHRQLPWAWAPDTGA